MANTLDRRQFLERLLALSLAGAATGLGACATPRAPGPTQSALTSAPTAAKQPTRVALSPAPATVPTTHTERAGGVSELPHLAVARGAGADPAELVRRAIAAVGGIEHFVRPGANVIIKPNICNAYHSPEYASTTNPEVVAAIVALCIGAGARRVRVMDYPFGGSAQAAYQASGIEAAVKAAGGQMEVMNRLKFRDTPLPGGRAVKQWGIYGDALDADVLINVPIAKTHGGAGLTLAMKNLMGVIQDRTGFHARGLHQCIADLCTAVKPQLTIIDAVRMLMANGPTGGNLDDVKRADTVIASADMVSADAYAATLFGKKPTDIGYIRLGDEMGLGKADLNSVRIEEVSV